MDHLIEYSSTELRKALERGLDECNVFRYNSEYREALGQSFLDKLARWEDSIARCKETPFTIVVAGDFKRGKSTLINAFLGEEAAAVDVTTETVTLNRISYGMPGNEAILSGGRSVRLADNELKREKLEDLMRKLGEPIQRLEIRRPCEMLKKVTIIDTPGTGDAMQDFSGLVKECLLQADAVVYVYNVQYPLSKSEQMFLKAAVLPQKYTSLFLIGNFADVLETKEAYDRMGNMLKQRVENLLPDAEPYMVSALDEFCCRTGAQTEKTELTEVLRQRFNDLREALDGLIDSRADHVIVDRMQRLALAMVQDLETELGAVDEGLQMDAAEADSMLREAEEAKQSSIEKNAEALECMDRAIRNMETETKAWMGDFMQRIVRETGHLGTMSNDDLKRYYEFYCVDLLQEAMNACVEYHRERLLDMMDSAAEGIGRRAVGELDAKKVYPFRIHLDNRIWTKGDTVGFVTSQVASASCLAYVASIVADGISGAMREKEKENRVPEFIEQISRKLLNMSAMVSDIVNTVYGELGEKAKKLLGDYYEEGMAQAQHLLEQTAQAAAGSAEEKEKRKKAVEKARHVLGNVRKCI